MEVKLGKRVVKDVIRGDRGGPLKRKAWLGRITNGLHFEAPDEDLQRAWSAIKEHVAATDRSYGELLAPRHRVEQRAENERRADAAQRIEDAQRLLDSLD